MRTNRKIMVSFLVWMSILLMGCAQGDEDITFEEIETEEATQAEETAQAEDESVNQDVEQTSTELAVHVCGQVANPGVYRLAQGSRIVDAIDAAGGLTDQAAEEVLNQAALLEDGQQIQVLSQEEAEDLKESTATVAGTAVGQQQSDKVNLNTASKEQLMTLNGVGESRALAIIQYREDNGGFKSIEDLMKVEGIKEGIFNKVKEQITI